MRLRGDLNNLAGTFLLVEDACQLAAQFFLLVTACHKKGHGEQGEQNHEAEMSDCFLDFFVFIRVE